MEPAEDLPAPAPEASVPFASLAHDDVVADRVRTCGWISDEFEAPTIVSSQPASRHEVSSPCKHSINAVTKQ